MSKVTIVPKKAGALEIEYRHMMMKGLYKGLIKITVEEKRGELEISHLRDMKMLR